MDHVTGVPENANSKTRHSAAHWPASSSGFSHVPGRLSRIETPSGRSAAQGTNALLGRLLKE
jgi:hypothetical protein